MLSNSRRSSESGGNAAFSTSSRWTENRPVGPRVDGQKRLAVAQEECPVSIFQFQLARFEDLAVLIAEDRQEEAIPQFLLDGPPIDVEVGGVRRGGAVLQHVGPPGVLARRCAHVVGHDIEDLAHRAAVQGGDQRPVVVLVAQLRVQLRVIDDGIAVRASRAGLQIGRSIEVADAQLIEIGHDRGGSPKRHRLRLELQAVGRRGMTIAAGDDLRDGLGKPLGPGSKVAHGRAALLKIRSSCLSSCRILPLPTA